jgi:hypothetical protein|tara:strand:+ start:883 stop:1092 length:210 start_codon:yes stop_codon:yes gene_type:complete
VDLDEPVLFLHERKCRVCGRTYSLTDGFYLTRKSRGERPSSYSYECKSCTIIRVKKKRKKDKPDVYPDW